LAVSQYGIGASEGDQRGAGEEQPLSSEHTVGTGECDDCDHRHGPGDHADHQHADGAAPTRLLGVQSVVGDDGRWAALGCAIAGGAQDMWPVAAEQPTDHPGRGDDDRERCAEHGQREERPNRDDH
jgi:hypothetical protein